MSHGRHVFHVSQETDNKTGISLLRRSADSQAMLTHVCFHSWLFVEYSCYFFAFGASPDSDRLAGWMGETADIGGVITHICLYSLCSQNILLSPLPDNTLWGGESPHALNALSALLRECIVPAPIPSSAFPMNYPSLLAQGPWTPGPGSWAPGLGPLAPGHGPRAPPGHGPRGRAPGPGFRTQD